jgi:hypothetical protein
MRPEVDRQQPTRPINASFTFNPTTMSPAPELHIEILFQTNLINSDNYGLEQVIKTHITPFRSRQPTIDPSPSCNHTTCFNRGLPKGLAPHLDLGKNEVVCVEGSVSRVGARAVARGVVPV